MSKKRIAELERELDALRTKEGKKKSRRYVTCGGCDRRSQIGKIVYLQTHYYVRPYSCSGGDYWTPSNGEFICPKCGVRNRLLAKYSDYAAKITALAPYFKEIQDTHDDDDHRGSFVNL
jgi:hypothetical protein